MKLFPVASTNPFDVKAALLAGHAQHPVIIHFPIALFIASIVFEVMAAWRKQPVLETVAYYNLLAAALTIPFAIATGLGAWHWQLEGAAIKGNLRLHMICALTSALLILLLTWMRASAYQGRFAACILFCSDGAGLNDDHPDRAPRWNPQRCGNAVSSRGQSYFRYLSNHPTV